MNADSFPSADLTRRQFLKQTTATAVTVSAFSSAVKPVFAAGSDTIRVGLIGCGSRGTGAVKNCVMSAPNIEVVALGDLFEDQVASALKSLKTDGEKDWSSSAPWNHARQVKVTPDNCFSGFDAYEKVIASEANLILLATPPHFRPLHLKAAIDAGKHVFMEKPVAVDPVGIRSIMASSALAKQKGLAIVAGTQRRHQPNYVETMKRVHDGAIGEITSGECYWNQGWVRQWGFFKPRQPDWSDMEWQCRNWYYFTWLSGDHIVEQHVHNIDVINWAMQAHPVEALGMGGREVRTEPEFGNIFDHFAVRYKYPNGAVVLSMARQIGGCHQLIWESVTGTEGRASAGRIEGANPFEFKGPDRNPYEQEHADLIRSIRDNDPLNEGRQVAESTLCAIMGRMSAYAGQPVSWEFALNGSELDLSPSDYRLGPLPVQPVAVPGETPLV